MRVQRFRHQADGDDGRHNRQRRQRRCEIVRRQAEAEATERIRSRNSELPDVLRSGGAVGAVTPDYANMPSEQFNKMRRDYDAQMRLGKRVRP